MTPAPKRRRKQVARLTDAQPRFVSLVTSGANQSPFLSLKAAESTMQVKTSQGTGEVAKLEFASGQFPDAAAVKQWLKDGGYPELEPVATEKGFEVSDPDVAPAGAEAVAAGDTGVTAHVVAAKADEPAPVPVEAEPVAEPAEAAPVAEPAPEPVVEPAEKAEPDPAPVVEPVEKATADTATALIQVVEYLTYIASDQDFYDTLYARDSGLCDKICKQARSLLKIVKSAMGVAIDEMNANLDLVCPPGGDAVDAVAGDLAQNTAEPVLKDEPGGDSVGEPVAPVEEDATKSGAAPETATGAPDAAGEALAALTAKLDQLVCQVGELATKTATLEAAQAAVPVSRERQTLKGASEIVEPARPAAKKEAPNATERKLARGLIGL